MTERRERAAVLCRPQNAYDDDEEIIPGSIEQWCSICATPVWMAPSSQELLERYDAVVFCTPCGVGVVETENAPEIMLPTQRQRDELARLGITEKELVEVLALVQVIQQAEKRRRKKK